MGDWGADNLQVVVVLNCEGGGGGVGIQVDFKKVPLVSVNWHNFDQILVHMFVFIYQHCCLIVTFMYFWYIVLFPSTSPSLPISSLAPLFRVKRCVAEMYYEAKHGGE